MHIVEQAAQGLQRRLHGLAEHMVGPEMLSHEVVKQALDRAQVALGPEPLSREALQQALDPARVAFGTDPVVPGLVRSVLDLERLVPGLVAQPLDPVAPVQSRAPQAHGPARQRREAL